MPTDEALVAFLEEAAHYFERRDTKGEDAAHWSNVANAENCRKAAARLAELSGGTIDDRVWFELRAPGCVPERKGPFRGRAAVAFCRELMAGRPGEFITVLTFDSYGGPLVQDGPEWPMVSDMRSRPTARRHMKTSAAAFAAATNTLPSP